jgi:hypothetical protein
MVHHDKYFLIPEFFCLVITIKIKGVFLTNYIVACLVLYTNHSSYCYVESKYILLNEHYSSPALAVVDCKVIEEARGGAHSRKEIRANTKQRKGRSHSWSASVMPGNEGDKQQTLRREE